MASPPPNSSSDSEENEHGVEVIDNPNLQAHPTGLRPEDVPALFWDEMPEDTDNPDLAAINALIEESTPEERAENFKDQGNRALKTGLKQRKKFFLRQAIEQYTEGINLQCSDAKLQSILLSNRAHVNLLLGNFRAALMDGQDAIRFDPGNAKGYYRAAKAALLLRKYTKCREICKQGLEAVPDTVELLTLLTDADHRQRHTQTQELSEAARQHALRAPARKLADALLSRGWKLGRPQFGVGDRKPRLDESTAEIEWPVLFFYPEASMQSDAVEAFGEGDQMGAHLDVMFGGDAPLLDWDVDGCYTRDHIEVYYLSHAAKPISREALAEALHGGWPVVAEEGPDRYGPRAARWVRVEEGWTLGDILGQEDHVAPGIPVFFVLAKNTPFKKQFLEGDIPLF